MISKTCLKRKYILFIKQNKPNLMTSLEYVSLASSLNKILKKLSKFYDGRDTL